MLRSYNFFRFWIEVGKFFRWFFERSSYTNSVHSSVMEEISYIKFLDKYKYFILFHFFNVYFSINLMELSSIIKIFFYILGDIQYLGILQGKYLMF